MSIKKFICKKAHISSKVDFYTVIKLCIKELICRIRGELKFLFRKHSFGKIYVERSCKIAHKKGIVTHGSLRIKNHTIIDGLGKDKIYLGDGVIIGSYCDLKTTHSLGDLGLFLKIGDGTTCGNYCFFGAAGGIEIGSNVSIGQNVRFHAQNHVFDGTDLIKNQGVISVGIKIGNNCWIGAGAVFLDGVIIGDGCVVGANAVVTKSFPDNSVIAGNPARLIRKRGDNN